MDLGEALERIETIHAQLARGEQYRGYCPFALTLSGLTGLAAALLQPWLVSEPFLFVRFWLFVALASAVLAGGSTLIGYLHEDSFARRRTRTVLGQFLPCLFAGAGVTLGVVHSGHLATGVVWLPGLWAVIYGLGVVASLPYLPRAAGWVAAWYLAWGLALFYIPFDGVPPGWSVGLPFGMGQLLAAGVLLTAGAREDHS